MRSARGCVNKCQHNTLSVQTHVKTTNKTYSTHSRTALKIPPHLRISSANMRYSFHTASVRVLNVARSQNQFRFSERSASSFGGRYVNVSGYGAGPLTPSASMQKSLKRSSWSSSQLAQKNKNMTHVVALRSTK
jgi:hypothetical protein